MLYLMLFTIEISDLNVIFVIFQQVFLLNESPALALLLMHRKNFEEFVITH